MIYFKLFDTFQKTITAHDDNWSHAIANHTELIGREHAVMSSIVNVQSLYLSDTASNVHLYVGPAIDKGTFQGENPVSVVRFDTASNGVWLTGYFTSLAPVGKKLWSRS
jgi:hypothetical protein